MWLIALKKCRDVSAKITVSVKSATRNSRKCFDKIGPDCDPTKMQQCWGIRSMELRDVSSINADSLEHCMNTKTCFSLTLLLKHGKRTTDLDR